MIISLHGIKQHHYMHHHDVCICRIHTHTHIHTYTQNENELNAEVLHSAFVKNMSAETS
jgi:hypothetical protein